MKHLAWAGFLLATFVAGQAGELPHLVQNGQAIEFGQPLLVVDPS